MSNLEVGIVGLPNVGKSTLFNAITKAGAEAANYPFCTIEPNVGVVDVPDPRLGVLHEMYQSKKTTPASVRFVDIAGLVRGASKGEGLGNQFLEHIRQVDAIAHVVRCFEDADITHVEGAINPIRDIEIITTELCLADLDTVEKRLVKAQKLTKSGNKEAKAEEAALSKIAALLGDAKPARKAELSDEERTLLRDLNLLTMKPVLYVAETMKAAELLKKLQESKCRMAIVLDEYGGTAGLVTIEDIVEELVGEIYDESDDAPDRDITLMQNGSYRIMGSANIEKVFDFFGEEADINATTANGWAAIELDKLPKRGDRFDYIAGHKKFHVIVSKSDDRKALELNLRVEDLNDPKEKVREGEKK